MKDRYVEIHGFDEGHSCMKSSNVWLCSGIKEVHHTEGQKTCELMQFIHPELDSLKYCEIQISIPKLIVTQLTTSNHWLIVEPNNEVFELMCNHKRSKHVLHGRGILVGEKGCQIRTPSTTLMSYKDTTKNISFAKSEFDLSMFLRNTNNSFIFNDSSLQYGPLKLQELPRSPPESDFKLPNHDIHHFAVGYSSLTICLILIVLIGVLLRYNRSILAVLHPKPTPRNPPNLENEVSEDLII